MYLTIFSNSVDENLISSSAVTMCKILFICLAVIYTIFNRKNQICVLSLISKYDTVYHNFTFISDLTIAFRNPFNSNSLLNCEFIFRNDFPSQSSITFFYICCLTMYAQDLENSKSLH